MSKKCEHSKYQPFFASCPHSLSVCGRRHLAAGLSPAASRHWKHRQAVVTDKLQQRCDSLFTYYKLYHRYSPISLNIYFTFWNSMFFILFLGFTCTLQLSSSGFATYDHSLIKTGFHSLYSIKHQHWNTVFYLTGTLLEYI